MEEIFYWNTEIVLPSFFCGNVFPVSQYDLFDKQGLLGNNVSDSMALNKSLTVI